MYKFICCSENNHPKVLVAQNNNHGIAGGSMGWECGQDSVEMAPLLYLMPAGIFGKGLGIQMSSLTDLSLSGWIQWFIFHSSSLSLSLPPC